MKLDSNGKLAVKLALIPLAMFGFGYALVPIYNVFCDVTGLNGKTGEISTVEAEMKKVDESRMVTVEFDTNVNGQLPWKFGPLQTSMQVHPGQVVEAMFYAENTSDHAIVGQAVPSMAPAAASVYFKKTECFCFTQQTLGPGERRNMPVRFIVDPKLPENISTMTLSYTFFQAKTAPEVAHDHAPDNKTDS